MTPIPSRKCRGLLIIAAVVPALAAAAPAYLENPQPGAPLSGIGVITGWACNAQRVEGAFDGGAAFAIPAGSSRPDTAVACGGAANSGFGFTFNWNNLAPGTHTLRVTADGAELATRSFVVVDLGGQWIDDRQQATTANDFPRSGQRTLLQWQAATQSFIVKEVRNDAPSLKGRWNGADLERRSGCTAPENNGNHGTYAQYQVDFSDTAFSLQESGVTGLTCTYSGPSKQDGMAFTASGTYSCSDGKTGTFATTGVMVTDREMSMQMAAKLTGTESCTIDKTLGGSRY